MQTFDKTMRCLASGVLATAILMTWQASRGDDTDQPYYQQLLTKLREHAPLIPAFDDLHPVHTVFNREAVVPPQCYTRTEGVHNPCYVCHQDEREGRENRMNDADLQLAYSFSEVGLTNRWLNLFEDRSERVAELSDQEILEWIDTDNYSALAGRLLAARFEGWIPDLAGLEAGAAAFDEEGFARDGSRWVAFNYKPLPSTFWPTNGSTDDVMIRLAPAFRSDRQGNYSHEIYKANLAIVEANMKGLSEITSLPIDETEVGRDLDQDGKLGTAHRITATDRYVGEAQDDVMIGFLYPEGTEFLHTVRYVGISDFEGSIVPSRRMKKVRYMRKWRAYGKATYARQYQLEAFEKDAGNLPGYEYLEDFGLGNKNGWAIQGFIEGRDGRLRISTYEENFFCMGCHNTVGSTIDKTFSFARKIDGARGWGYIDLDGMPDAPNIGETVGEIETYLARVGGGDEFRSNSEMRERWFLSDGSVDRETIAAADVYALITPSIERALVLNKAYRVIVDDQDFIYGRDATVTPPVNVYDRVDPDTAPTLPPERNHAWDIRLDWERFGELRPED